MGLGLSPNSSLTLPIDDVGNTTRDTVLGYKIMDGSVGKHAPQSMYLRGW